jgi:hypothetical protein
MIDGPVWERVADVLRDPAIIMAEVERRRQDGDLDREIEALDRLLASTVDKQARLARRVAAIDDDDAAAPLLVELRSLAATKTTTERRRDELAQRIADRAAENAKVQTLADWCATVNANLDTLTYEERRMALTWLGVEVQVYRTDARDEDGDPLPRWAMTLAPLMPERDIVYGSTYRMTAASRSCGMRDCSEAPSDRAPRTMSVVVSTNRTLH